MRRNILKISLFILLVSLIVAAAFTGDRVIRSAQLVVLKSMKTMGNKPVIMGRDGWMFYTGDRAMEQYLGLRPFSQDQLREFAMILNGRKEYLEKRNIRYLFVVAPSKESIYQEFLPVVSGTRTVTPLDQLIDYLRANSSVEVIDLREELRAAKRVRHVYQKTDTHWNDFGAYIANRSITRELSRMFPSIAAMRNPRYRFKIKNCTKGDLAVMVGMKEDPREDCVSLADENVFHSRKAPIDKFYRGYKFSDTIAPDPRVVILVMERRDSPLPRAVVFRDSYSFYLMPFLSENFSRVLYIWDYRFNKDFIEHEKPDIVIDQVAERVMTVFLMRNMGKERGASGTAMEKNALDSGSFGRRTADGN